MLLHKEARYTIYFGSAEDSLFPTEYLALDPSTHLLDKNPYNKLQGQMQISCLFFLKQIHSNTGYRIEESPLQPAFATEGDYLLTTTKHAGIGVMTADCLPIIVVDEKNHQIAAIHAGWKGSVAGILQKAISNLNVPDSALKIFFGPSARACCYEVDSSFKDHIPPSLQNTVIQTRADRHFFDLPGFNQALIAQIAPASTIITTYNFCTLCNHRFFSYRRQGTAAGRQMTVAALR